MDLNEYWQENKRFLTIVTGGALVFLIGEMVIGKVFGADLNAAQRSVAASQRSLGEKGQYGTRDLAQAKEENEALARSAEVLAKAVAFQPRPEFRIDPQKGSAASQFFSTVASTREALLSLAGRSGLRLPDAIGLPALSPTQEADIARHLEALDLIDRIVRLSVDAGVERIDKIDIELDPGLTSRHGVGAVERTRVKLAISGSPVPIQRLLLATQASDLGAALIVELEMIPSKQKPDEARLEATFAVARIAPGALETSADEEPK